MLRNGVHTASNNSRPSTATSEKKEIWSTLLNKVSSGKKVPEKHLIVLGGTQESQRDFLESLAQKRPNRNRQPDRSGNKKPPIANQFALGYTYQDVYDTEHEDLLARLSIHILSSPSLAYAPLLAHLLTADTIPSTSIAILLDWKEPWHFVRQLRAWIRLLQTVIHALPPDAQSALEENITTWHHTRNAALSSSVTDTHTSLPLGPGEYDEPLGLPLLIVCQNALAMETLEKEQGYREPQFDYILQFLRTVLLKHGAGLIYTMPGQPGQLQPLIYTMLNIDTGALRPSSAGKEKGEAGLRHNVVDQDRVIVPPGWDSHGKIRVHREGFDVEGLSGAWGVDIQPPPPIIQSIETEANGSSDELSDPALADPLQLDPEEEAANPHSTVVLYESTIQDPHPPNNTKPTIEVPLKPEQTFLAEQLTLLDRYRRDDEAEQRTKSRTAPPARRYPGLSSSTSSDAQGGAMRDQLGPVQFNMGGIQYDAEQVVRGLQERNRPREETPVRTRSREGTPFSPRTPGDGAEGETDEDRNLKNFFAGLMKPGRAGSQSASNSPRPERRE